MRRLILTAVLAGLLAVPATAQFTGRGGIGGGGADALLGIRDVQKELKLTEEQTKAIATANEERGKAMRQAFQDMDREAFQKIGQEYAKAITKVKEGLSSEQKSRLGQLEVQAAIKGNQVRIFAK